MRFWNAATLAIVALSATTAASKDARRAPPFSPSIHVDVGTVLCISQRGIQPTAKPVAPKGKRPAGLAVYGVGALGVGVADGDVLTEVLGQPVRTQIQVVAMVMAARSAAMRAISGTLWRGMRPYTVTVDQPYDVPDCSSDDPSCWRARCPDEKPQREAPAEGSKKNRAGTKR